MKKQEKDEESNTVEMINVSAEVVKFEVDGTRHKLAPLQTVTIHRAYALPKQLQPGRDPIPSTVEMLTNKKVLPVDDKRAKSAVGAARQKAANPTP